MNLTNSKLNRKTAPAIVDAVDFNLQLKPYRKIVLKNGVEVYCIDAGAEEVMSLEWVFFAGNTWEKENLIAASANFLLKNGTSRHTAFQINEHFDYYGSYFNRACYNETASLSLHTLTRYVRELLPMAPPQMRISNPPFARSSRRTAPPATTPRILEIESIS